MAAENLSEVARTVEATDEFELRAPSEHSWVLMAYTYLGEFMQPRREGGGLTLKKDTRPTPLAGINIFDLNNNPVVRNPFIRNSQEAFPLIRTSFILRGLMDSCGVQSSMAVAWEKYARSVEEGEFREAGAADLVLKRVKRSANKFRNILLGLKELSDSSQELREALALAMDAQAGRGAGTEVQRDFVQQGLMAQA